MDKSQLHIQESQSIMLTAYVDSRPNSAKPAFWQGNWGDGGSAL